MPYQHLYFVILSAATFSQKRPHKDCLSFCHSQGVRWRYCLLSAGAEFPRSSAPRAFSGDWIWIKQFGSQKIPLGHWEIQNRTQKCGAPIVLWCFHWHLQTSQPRLLPRFFIDPFHSDSAKPYTAAYRLDPLLTVHRPLKSWAASSKKSTTVCLPGHNLVYHSWLISSKQPSCHNERKSS